MNRILTLAACVSLAVAAAAAERPNLLLILADDLGWSDLGCYGGEIRTPALDALAADGVRFTQFYNSSRCCPSRASILTGLHPHQAGFPLMSGTLPPDSATIAEGLRPAGYGRYMTGKWHITGIKPEALFEEVRHVRGGMPATCEAAYERPGAQAPDLWQPWDESRGGHWQGGQHWSAVTADDVEGLPEK